MNFIDNYVAFYIVHVKQNQYTFRFINVVNFQNGRALRALIAHFDSTIFKLVT